jgi:hypothetical protein
VSALAVWLITLLAVAVVGLGVLAAYALRRASRTADRILSDELGHRGAHETYDKELHAWRNASRDY